MLDYSSKMLISGEYYFTWSFLQDSFRKHCPLCHTVPLYKFLLELNTSKKLTANE